MDEEIEIINTNTRVEKLKNFLISKRKQLITLLILIILILITFFGYQEFKSSSKEKLANKFNSIVTNFETLVSNLELINTTTEHIPIIPQKFLKVDNEITNLRADSTDYTADNATLTVDTQNNIEGLEELSVTEVVPEDVSIPNIPQQVIRNVPLVVTPPVLTYLTTAPTSSVVTISFTVTTLGKVGTTSQIDEYGFFYSTTKSHLTSTDISTL